MRARIPVSSPESSDSEDMYHAALKVSSERKNRPRMFSRKGDGSRSASRDRSYNRGHVRSTVKDLLQKNDSVLVRLLDMHKSMCSFCYPVFLRYCSNILCSLQDFYGKNMKITEQ